jgi:hypothetical protein
VRLCYRPLLAQSIEEGSSSALSRHDGACLGCQLSGGAADIRFGSPNVSNEAHTENPTENAKCVTMISLVILFRENLYTR